MSGVLFVDVMDVDFNDIYLSVICGFVYVFGMFEMVVDSLDLIFEGILVCY